MTAPLLAASGAGGVDWKLYLGIPAAALAVIALVSYAVGAARPMAVRKARYWYEGEATRFSCAIRNRSLMWDRDITGLSVVSLPSWWHRLVHPRWDRKPQKVDVIPFGEDIAKIAKGEVKLTKREERILKGELRDPAGRSRVRLGTRHRFRAHSGSRRSRSKRPRQVDIPGAG